MEDKVDRQECRQSMDRIHIRIDEIQKSVVRIEESAKTMQKFSEDIHKVIFGNGNDGVITKIARMFERVSLHTKLITGTVLAIIARIVILIFNIFDK